MVKRFLQPLRILVQWIYLLLSLYLGVQLFRFVEHFSSGGVKPFVPRPDGVEAFLPISAILSAKDWLLSGNINPIHPAALVIFLSALAGSFFMKRSFCSWICPVGTISEQCWKSGFRLFRRNFRPPLWLDMLLRCCKYILLLFFLFSILVVMSPQAVDTFIHSDYNKIADVRLLDFFLHPSGFSLVVIGTLVLLSLPIRNPFCRFLCPYGALLGLISVCSPVKVTRDGAICVSCGACTQVCPSYIPVMSKERVMSEECIGCLRCISHCRAEGALEMKLTGKRIVVHGLLFAALVVAIFWGGTLVGKATGHWQTGISPEEYTRLLGTPEKR